MPDLELKYIPGKYYGVRFIATGKHYGVRCTATKNSFRETHTKSNECFAISVLTQSGLAQTYRCESIFFKLT